MSLASRVAALAQRIGAELHDTDWTDLTAYLRPEIAGMLRARTKAGVTIVHGEVTLPSSGSSSPGISDPIPSQFRPPQIESDTYISAPILATPRSSGGGHQFHADGGIHRRGVRYGSLDRGLRTLHVRLLRGLTAEASGEPRGSGRDARGSCGPGVRGRAAHVQVLAERVADGELEDGDVHASRAARCRPWSARIYPRGRRIRNVDDGRRDTPSSLGNHHRSDVPVRIDPSRHGHLNEHRLRGIRLPRLTPIFGGGGGSR